MTAEESPPLAGYLKPQTPILPATHRLKELLSDVEPLFCGRPVIYVDAAAREGENFRGIQASSLEVRAAHLIEADAESFAALERNVRELGAEDIAVCHKVALAAAAQRLDPCGTPEANGNAGGSDADPSQAVGTEAGTLGAIIKRAPGLHVSILRIDAATYKRGVLEGATPLLAANAVDLIWADAGLNPSGAEPAFLPDLEDALRVHRYHLFRIYRGHGEPLERLPSRSVSFAFLSETFAARNPYRLTRKLFSEPPRQQDLARARPESDTSREAPNETLSGSSAEVEADPVAAAHAEALAKRDAALASAHQRLEAQENRARELQISLTTRLEEIAQLTRMLEAANRRLDAVTRSTSWRLTAPVRGVAALVRRQR